MCREHHCRQHVRKNVVNKVPELTFALTFALHRTPISYRDAAIAWQWHETG
jgi:hypothetical protein